jgi:hypothetical protein
MDVVEGEDEEREHCTRRLLQQIYDAQKEGRDVAVLWMTRREWSLFALSPPSPKATFCGLPVKLIEEA